MPKLGEYRQLASDEAALRIKRFAADLQALCERADAILLVDEWSGSRGCRCEAFVAHTCGKTMLNEKLEEPADYKSMNIIFGQK